MIESIVLVLTSFPGSEDQKSVHVLENNMRSICSGQIFFHINMKIYGMVTYTRKTNGNHIIFLLPFVIHIISC